MCVLAIPTSCTAFKVQGIGGKNDSASLGPVTVSCFTMIHYHDKLLKDEVAVDCLIISCAFVP